MEKDEIPYVYEDLRTIPKEELEKAGMLAKLQDYEPVDFWKEN